MLLDDAPENVTQVEDTADTTEVKLESPMESTEESRESGAVLEGEHERALLSPQTLPVTSDQPDGAETGLPNPAPKLPESLTPDAVLNESLVMPPQPSEGEQPELGNITPGLFALFPVLLATLLVAALLRLRAPSKSRKANRPPASAARAQGTPSQPAQDSVGTPSRQEAQMASDLQASSPARREPSMSTAATSPPSEVAEVSSTMEVAATSQATQADAVEGAPAEADVQPTPEQLPAAAAVTETHTPDVQTEAAPAEEVGQPSPERHPAADAPAESALCQQTPERLPAADAVTEPAACQQQSPAQQPAASPEKQSCASPEAPMLPSTPPASASKPKVAAAAASVSSRCKLSSADSRRSQQAPQAWMRNPSNEPSRPVPSRVEPESPPPKAVIEDEVSSPGAQEFEALLAASKQFDDCGLLPGSPERMHTVAVPGGRRRVSGCYFSPDEGEIGCAAQQAAAVARRRSTGR